LRAAVKRFGFSALCLNQLLVVRPAPSHSIFEIVKPAGVAVYGIFGFGFYLLYGCIQVHVTELSQTARGAAVPPLKLRFLESDQF
jgi:hypothetical protein